MSARTNRCHPFVYSKSGNIITPNDAEGVPVTSQFLLGAKYIDSRANYLFYDPGRGNLLVGHENTVDVQTSNSAIIASAGINLKNCQGVMVAGLDYSGLLGSEIRGFKNTLIAREMVSTEKFRVGSLNDQGSSVIVAPKCPPDCTGTQCQYNCVPVYRNGVFFYCQCGEAGDVAKTGEKAETSDAEGGNAEGGAESAPCSARAETVIDPIFTSYGSGHIKGDLVVDSLIYTDSVTATRTITAPVGSFGRNVAGSTLSGFMQVPLEAPVFDVFPELLSTYLLVAPIQFPQEIRLFGGITGFIPSQTYTFKDTCLEHGEGQLSYNFVITCDIGTFMEVRDPDTGALIRRNGGGYVVDTVGGSVSFLFYQTAFTNELTWLVTNENRGSPRIQP